jgi:hypothetical protein
MGDKVTGEALKRGEEGMILCEINGGKCTICGGFFAACEDICSVGQHQIGKWYSSESPGTEHGEFFHSSKKYRVKLSNLKRNFAVGNGSPRHELIKKEKLLADVLAEIRIEHQLKRCPLCGKPLATDSLCSRGMRISHEPDDFGKDEYKQCGACHIIWHLHLHNWINERGDGMESGRGHQLFLEGTTNCFCRRQVLGDSGLIDDKKGHHSQLSCRCPNAK